MTYWLLIIVLFSPQWELKNIYHLEAFKSRDACVKVMERAIQEQPEFSHLHCFPAKIPLPPYRIPI